MKTEFNALILMLTTCRHRSRCGRDSERNNFCLQSARCCLNFLFMLVFWGAYTVVPRAASNSFKVFPPAMFGWLYVVLRLNLNKTSSLISDLSLQRGGWP